MTWTPVASSVATWSAGTSSVGTWSASAASSVGWQQLSAITEGDGGVDFVLRVNDDYPLLVLDSRPSYIIDDIEVP